MDDSVPHSEGLASKCVRPFYRKQSVIAMTHDVTDTQFCPNNFTSRNVAWGNRGEFRDASRMLTLASCKILSL